ncbi:MAG: ABC transporter ATP-binding protein [Crocinitomicaceae bacterium]|nr:ABC transporter ATP-binding protein [Crocinitomicaceae bacterium]
MIQSRLKTATSAILHGNNQFGFRAFVDCILDTENPEWFKKCIDLMKQKEAGTIDDNHFYELILNYLSKLSEDISNSSYNATVLLNAKNVSRSYGSGKFALKDISLKINPGEVIGLVGENGNGKTTLLRILAQELSFDAGTIEYAIADKERYDLRTQLIYIPQRTPTWYGSLYDNLKFTAANYGVNGELNQLLVDMLIIRFGLWDYRKLNWSELSSGYKMRFELARTFLRKPKILLLDEPLGNLDVKSQQIILEDLKGLAQSPTNPIGVVLSSQQLFEVEKVADKILFLRNGIPEYYADKLDEKRVTATIVELETMASVEDVKRVFLNHSAFKLTFNGGVYTIETEEPEAFKKILSELANSDLEIVYIRDISHSTRRFFI